MSIPKPNTRLLRVSNIEADTVESNSAFTIDLGNTINEIGEGVTGISVEAVGFVNADPNVLESLLFQISNAFPPTTQQASVPRGQYTVDYIMNEIKTSMPDIIDVVLNDQQKVEITATLNVGQLEGDAWGILGFTDDQINVAVGGSITANALPRLGGLQVAYLHSSVLADSQHAIDGEGILVSFMTPIPVDVPFGSAVYYDPRQNTYPSIVYKDPLSMRRLNITIRGGDGHVVDSGSSEVWAVFRLWL